MFKVSFIKHSKVYTTALFITLILIVLQFVFPQHELVKTYFIELTFSSISAVIGCIALITKFLLNILKIEISNSIKNFINFFINKISYCFIAIFGFCTAMMIANIISENYKLATLYLILGLFGLIYSSATIFLNIKLEVRGYLT
ncbi:hypothetical protein KTH11_07940 [Acinetobacter baumannii]|uniref:hypothetical protein n=1 Tax=Acinetobacter baumannii TaxID=470 RepID=UPI0021BD51E6|nr:hypothetical protein [Acinetobacter baumannii]MDC5200439.1 hypothetical protein [Acinetobacter baumannii]HAV5379921.1 hypothetical protein [Acinetobacter baumannii]